MGDLEHRSESGTGELQHFAERLADFNSNLAFRLKVLDEVRRHLNPYLARDFNIFECLAPDENRLSAILAELLTPDGKHGQGGTFLDLFLKMINHPELSAEARVTVRCQAHVYVPEGGLIDITVNWPDFGLAIENKPWAIEQKDQLRRYWQDLSKRYGASFCLVFLDGRGKDPESIAKADRLELESKRQFKTVSYAPDLQRWLQVCAKESQADKLRWFLRDFAEYVGRFQVPAGSTLP